MEFGQLHAVRMCCSFGMKVCRDHVLRRNHAEPVGLHEIDKEVGDVRDHNIAIQHNWFYARVVSWLVRLERVNNVGVPEDVENVAIKITPRELTRQIALSATAKNYAVVERSQRVARWWNDILSQLDVARV